MRCAWPKPVRTCRFPTLHAEPAEVFSLRRCALGSAILVLIAALRIVSTYTVLSHTIDEPIHLGAGMEWLDHGTITGDASHPPLARALSAIGPDPGPRGRATRRMSRFTGARGWSGWITARSGAMPPTRLWRARFRQSVRTRRANA